MVSSSTCSAATTAAAWEARQDRGISLIQSRGASIVGFQELQPNQFRRWRGRMPGWGFFPGESQGFKGTPTNLVWNSGVWSFVEGYTFGIPRPDGTRPQPAVSCATRPRASRSGSSTSSPHLLEGGCATGPGDG